MKNKNLAFLSFRYLKQNIHRTITTIIGVTLSTIMIYFVVAGGFSLYHANSKNNYEQSFGWDAIYIIDKEETARSMLALDPYYGEKEADENIKHAFSFMGNYDAVAVNDFNAVPYEFHLKYGVLPKTENGIVLSEFNAKIEKLKVGDIYEVHSYMMPDGSRGESKQYQVCGVTDSSKTGGFSLGDSEMIIYADSNFVLMRDELWKEISDISPIYVCLSFQNKNNLEEIAKEYANRYEIEKYYINPTALDYYVEGNNSLNYLASNAVILMIGAIVSLLSIILVRNAFNLSVNERSNDYGILRCIGMSRKHIIRLIAMESIIISTIGLFFGMIIGHGFGVIVFRLIRKAFALSDVYRMYFIPKAIFIAVLFVIVASAYAMIAPIEKLYKITPIEALRQTDNIKNKIKKVRKHKLIQTIFGTEIWYAYRNVARRKGRFLLTTLTLSIGSTIFIALPTGFNIIEKNSFKELGIDICDGSFYVENYSEAKALQKKLQDNNFLTNSYIYAEFYAGYSNHGDTEGVKNSLEGLFLGLEPEVYEELKKKSNSASSLSRDGIELIMVGEDNKFQLGDVVSFYTKNDVDNYVINYQINPNNLSDILFKHNILPMNNFEQNTCYVFDISTWNGPVHSNLKNGYDIIGHDIYLKVKINNEKGTKAFDMFIYESPYIYYDETSEFKMYISGMNAIKMIITLFILFFLAVIISNNINIVRSDMILRRKEFKILRTIGMSYKQESKMIYLENFFATMLAFLISSLSGTLIGFGFSSAFLYDMVVQNEIVYQTDWLSIFVIFIILFLFSFLTVFFTREEDVLEA